MSAVLLHTLSVLDAKPHRIEGFHSVALDEGNAGAKVRFGYRVTKHGRPNSRHFDENDPDADGVPTEVLIVKTWLTDKDEVAVTEVPTQTFSAYWLQDREEEISQLIDDGEL